MKPLLPGLADLIKQYLSAVSLVHLIKKLLDKTPNIRVLVVIEHTRQTKSSVKRRLFSMLIAAPVAFVADLHPFPFAGDLHTALLDELDDFWQFFGVEPHAVFFANIDDDRRRVCKIAAVHQLFAVGTGYIAYLCRCIKIYFAVVY